MIKKLFFVTILLCPLTLSAVSIVIHNNSSRQITIDLYVRSSYFFRKKYKTIIATPKKDPTHINTELNDMIVELWINNINTNFILRKTKKYNIIISNNDFYVNETEH